MSETKLGKYDLRNVLGKGAMGTVYEGWDPMIARRVAIKTVRLPDPSDEEAADELARFKREAQAAGRLTHPNIVGVFDYGETGEIAYIVMEFVDGRSLKDMLEKDERFPIAETVRVMEGLLEGLAFSHKAGVVHRDIKPANIMITAVKGDGGGQVKIADFGIARIESSSMTQAGTIMGTPAYMSPEQFMGQTVDLRTDLYSSGVVLYQMLTGERPFTGSMSAIMHKALNTEAPAPSVLSVTAPRAFDAIIKRAMARRPEDRFQSATEFAQALRAALTAPVIAEPEDDATMVATAPRPAPVPRQAPPEPAVAASKPPGGGGKVGLMAGVAAVVLALAGGGAWFALRPGETPQAPSNPGVTQQTQPATQVQPARTAAQTPPPEPTSTPPVNPPAPPTSQPASPLVKATTLPLIKETTAPQAPPSPPTPNPELSAASPDTPKPPAPPTETPTSAANAPAPQITPAIAVAPPVTPPVTPANPNSQLAFNQPPPEPPPPAKPTPGELRDAVANALTGLDCSFVQSLGETADGVSVTVIAGEGEPADAVTRAVEGAAGNAAKLTVTGFSGPYCAALNALAGIAPEAPRLDLALASGSRPLKNNEVIKATIAGPAYPFYTQLDYVTHDDKGAIAMQHLAPNGFYPQHASSPGSRASYGEPNKARKFDGYTVGPPFGTDIIVGVASSAPLFAKDPEDSEPADEYFKRLADAIAKARAAGASVAVQVVAVTTKEK